MGGYIPSERLINHHSKPLSIYKVAHLRSELLDHVLALKIPNLDGGPGGGAQPVPETGEVQ